MNGMLMLKIVTPHVIPRFARGVLRNKNNGEIAPKQGVKTLFYP